MQHARRTFLCGAAGALALPLVRASATASQMTGSQMTVDRAGAGEVHPRRAPVEDAASFLEAVRRGDLATVQGQLAARPELCGAVDEQGCSAFAVALMAGFPAVAQVLRESGHGPDLVESAMAADWERFAQLAEGEPGLLDAHHPVGGSPLYGAARVGSEGLWRVQSFGVPADGRPLGPRGSTPTAAALACTDPVAAWCTLVDLLGNGANVHARQPGGATLLHLAAARGDLRLIETLLEFGADPGATDDRGLVPHHWAAKRRHGAAAARLTPPVALPPRVHDALRYAYDSSGGEVLLEPLWDVTAQRQGEITGSSHTRFEEVRAALAAEPRLWRSFSSQQELAIEACGHTGQRDIVRLHLDCGAPQSLATSITLGDLERAKALLELDPRAVHERGPHHFALAWYPALGGAGAQAMEFLLDRGLPLEQHSKGTTALHWAARVGDLDLIRLLIERGAAPGAVGYQFERAGQTPREMALAQGQTAAAALLAEHGG
jgi:hypothetical protein